MVTSQVETTKSVILCVDDEKMILDSLNRQLQRYFKNTYEFEFAESAEEALGIIRELQEDGYKVVMVISDQIMPGMSGDEFLVKIHKDYPQTVNVLLTGQASLQSAINSINKANLYRYITKPWDEDDFLLTIERGLEKYRLQEQNQHQLELFSRYVPFDFLKCLSKESMLDIRLGDHVEREMSILFTDIRNFTTISEILSPEETYSFINHYLGYVESAIRKNNGFIDKFIGDAVMALFYKPEEAFQASLEIQKAVVQFNQDFHDQKFYPVVSGIGLHTGMLTLGIVGVESRMQSTVISDAVNLASRMQDLTSKVGGLIIASGSFMEALRANNRDLDDDSIRFLGKVFVKGKKQVIPIYEIISKDNDPQADQKVNSRTTFAEGLNLFFNKNFAESCVKFKLVLDQNPEDKFAHRYLNLAAKYMLEGVKEDWEGIAIADVPVHHNGSPG